MAANHLPLGLDAEIVELTQGINRLRALMPLVESRWDAFSLAFTAAGREADRVIASFDKIVATMPKPPEVTG